MRLAAHEARENPEGLDGQPLPSVNEEGARYPRGFGWFIAVSLHCPRA